MTINPITGLFSRVWKFVDRRQAGDDITRSDLDIALDDLANGVNSALLGSLHYVGEWAAGGAFPTALPNGTAIKFHDTWIVSADGTSGGVVFRAGEYLVAMKNAPGATYSGNWLRLPTPDAYATSLVEALVFTETQMRTVSEFSTLAAFESYRAAFDYWTVGSLVNVGDMTFQKRASDGGIVWVRVDQEADKLINSYLEDVAGSVEPRHLASIPAMSLLGNALVRQGRPRGVPYEEFFYNIGARWYGDTASGGVNIPRSEATPDAANAMRSGRGTSSAGATTVTFHTAFAPCTPNVVITPKAIDLADTPLTATLIGAPIPESFSFVIKDSTGTAVARDFTYIATGNGDY